ncbi:ABC transporter permease [Clostridium tarantellae]|uniref:ABC transporter permease n=1 Tax=Clostridium tarantellae TaxID=39493 RepID=A0A6I1MLF6_9CLOT|nr:ABC transporter permease [Clostridium tarantellae]MPQ42947.1 ABC transporter permease [Clostridium tarantellae]
MLITLIKNEFLKQKRNLLLLMVLMIPIGVGILLSVDLIIRYENWLLPKAQKIGISSWTLLVKEQRILYFNDFMPLFSAIIIGELLECEYKNNGWLLNMTQPIKRRSILFSKYITSIIYVVIMLTSNIIVLIILGKIFNFPESLPWNYFITMFSIQLISSCAVMVIHLFITIKNKNVLISFGIAALLSIVSSNLYYNKSFISNINPYNFALVSYKQNMYEVNNVHIISFIFIIGGFFLLNKYFKCKKVY